MFPPLPQLYHRMMIILLVGSILTNGILALMLARRSKDVDRLAADLHGMGKAMSGMYFGCEQCGRIVPLSHNPMRVCTACHLGIPPHAPFHPQGRVKTPGPTYANTTSSPE